MPFKHTEWLSLFKNQKKIISQTYKLLNMKPLQMGSFTIIFKSFSWTSKSKLDLNCVFNFSFQSLYKAFFTPTVIYGVMLKMCKHTSDGLHIPYSKN